MRSVLVLCVLAGIAAVGISKPIADVAAANETELVKEVKAILEKEVNDELDTTKTVAVPEDAKNIDEEIINEALKNADMSENVIPDNIIEKEIPLSESDTPLEPETVPSSVSPVDETLVEEPEVVVEVDETVVLDEEVYPEFIVPEDLIRSNIPEDFIPIDEEPLPEDLENEEGSFDETDVMPAPIAVERAPMVETEEPIAVINYETPMVETEEPIAVVDGTPMVEDEEPIEAMAVVSDNQKTTVPAKSSSVDEESSVDANIDEVPQVEDQTLTSSNDSSSVVKPTIVEIMPDTRVTFIETFIESQPEAIPEYPDYTEEQITPIRVFREDQYPETNSQMDRDYHPESPSSYSGYSETDYPEYTDSPDSDYTGSDYPEYTDSPDSGNTGLDYPEYTDSHDSGYGSEYGTNYYSDPDYVPEGITLKEAMMHETNYHSDPDYIPEVVPYDEPMMHEPSMTNYHSDPDYVPEVVPYDEPMMHESPMTNYHSDPDYVPEVMPYDEPMMHESPMTNTLENHFMESSGPVVLTESEYNQQFNSNSDVHEPMPFDQYDESASMGHTNDYNEDIASAIMHEIYVEQRNNPMPTGNNFGPNEFVPEISESPMSDSMIKSDANTEMASPDMANEHSQSTDLSSFVKEMFSTFESSGFGPIMNMNANATVGPNDTITIKLQFNRSPTEGKMNLVSFMNKLIGQANFPAPEEYERLYVEPQVQRFDFVSLNPFAKNGERYVRSHLDDIRRRMDYSNNEEFSPFRSVFRGEYPYFY